MANFRKISWRAFRAPIANTLYLMTDNWDDFGYSTLFHLSYYGEDLIEVDLGSVKIAHFGQSTGPLTSIDSEFNTLGDHYFSLGQSAEYYSNILALGDELSTEILRSLRDIVFIDGMLSSVKNEPVYYTSLIRSVSISSIQGQFKRIISGEAELTSFCVNYNLNDSDGGIKGYSIKFDVNPNSMPSTNINVLIGRNGVGKTHLFRSMIDSLINRNREVGFFELTESNNFGGIVSVSFSAFDPFQPIKEKEDKRDQYNYSYVGLKKDVEEDGKFLLKNRDDLRAEFVSCVGNCIRFGKSRLLLKAIEHLSTDILFERMNLNKIFEDNFEDEGSQIASNLFSKMSSGHAIILLIITKLVEKIEEKTLVLIDEPEGHLHPPLLSAFIRALSNLLIAKNAVSIIATHSPVILQEIPKTNVRIMRRTGYSTDVNTPEIETFGENVGVLTREVFDLEVTNTGFNKLLVELVDKGFDFEEITAKFNEQLGLEARLILKALLRSKS